MNDVTTLSRNLTVAKRGCTCRLHSTLCVLGEPTPVDVVFAATIHADDGAVMVVVRQGPLAGAPYKGEDCPGRGTDPKISQYTPLFAHRRRDPPPVRDPPANHPPD